MTAISTMPAALEKRLLQLLDEDEIRKLHYRYARIMDEGFCGESFPADDLAELWTEDGVWEGGDFGTFTGREAIAAFFRRHALDVPFAVHYAANEQIVLAEDGQTATMRALMLVPCTFTHGGTPDETWIFGAWHNAFRKVDGRWYFTRLSAEIYKAVPHGLARG